MLKDYIGKSSFKATVGSNLATSLSRVTTASMCALVPLFHRFIEKGLPNLVLCKPRVDKAFSNVLDKDDHPEYLSW